MATAHETRGDRASAALDQGVKRVKARWSEWFSDFWSRYPRKVKKRDALKAWVSIAPRSAEEVMPKLRGIAQLLADRRRDEWRDRPPDKIPHPATFLRGEEFPMVGPAEEILDARA